MEEFFNKNSIETNYNVNLKEENLNGLPKIKLFGVGGGGGNMLNHMAKQINQQDLRSIELFATNTDAQALQNIVIPDDNKITLGYSITKGMGAGMKPEIGLKATLESEDLIRKKLLDTEILFLSGGLGGGTGSGALPQIAKIAKGMGILTIAVVTKPFNWEGKKRMEYAEKALSELEIEVDSLIVIPNDKLMETKINNNEKISLSNAFIMVNEILVSAVLSITSIIVDNSESNINLDFADVKTVMQYKGKALMTMGKGSTSTEAINKAILSPLLENFSIDGSKGILVNFKVNPNVSLLEINKGMELISNKVSEEAEIIFGTIYDEELGEEEVEIVLVATGFLPEETEKVFEEEVEKQTKANNIIETTNVETPKKPETTKIKRRYENINDLKSIPTFIRNRENN